MDYSTLVNTDHIPQWAKDLFSDGMIDMFGTVKLNNSIWDWLVSLLIVLGSVLLAKIVYWLVSKYVKRLAKKTRTQLDDILVDKLEEPVVFAIVIIGLWTGYARLDFSEGFASFAQNVFHILIAIDVTWMIARVVDALIGEYLVPLVDKTENDLDDQLMPILRKGIRWVIWTLGIIVGLNNAGYNVGALLAGLGIGGIAMAMAAKDFVANIFGGVTVFIDKPFKLGDRIQIGGFDGMVQDIGIRSTRLKTLAGRIVTVPNHKFTDSFVENVSMEPWRKVNLKLGLVYDTPPAKLEEAIKILQEINDRVAELEDECIISFTDFGDFSLGITFIYFIKKDEDVMLVPSKVNLEILKEFNEAGLDFAFPTQTLHVESEADQN